MQLSRQDLRRSLQGRAFQQAGYFTTAQALEVGYSYQTQKYHVDHGNWVRIDRALYRLPDWPPGPDDVFVRWTLWSAGRAVVSHESALAVHDLSDVNPRRVHLSVPRGFGAKDDAVVLHTANVPADDVEHRMGWDVTTVQRTLLDAAASGISQEHLDRAVTEALERGLVTRRRLRLATENADDRAALHLERSLVAVSLA